MGAYASGPVVAEAAVRGIPTVAVEMDSHMGWTNRILSCWWTRYASRSRLPSGIGDKYVYTGRPLRPALLSATREEGLARFGLDPDRPGTAGLRWQLGGPRPQRGGGGALSRAHSTAFQIVHVTGEREYAQVSVEAWGLPGPTPATRLTLSWTISPGTGGRRRGGGPRRRFVAEILARGCPSLLVPYPLRGRRSPDQERAHAWSRRARRSWSPTPISTRLGWPQAVAGLLGAGDECRA